MKESLTSPIIVMGMHRSGTTLISNVMSSIGVYMGKGRNKTKEASFFVEINDWILHELGGRWDNPPDMDILFSDEDSYKYTIKYINHCISSHKFIKYLGIKNYLIKSLKIKKENILWGWKDPRNVFTLPIWMDVFPNAKIIYIERNGIDVAQSLRTRSQLKKKINFERLKKYKHIYTLGLKDFQLSSSVRCCNLEASFALWDSYIKQSEKNIKQLSKTNVLKLKYEDLVNNPILEINRIIEFTGAIVSDEVTRKLANDINKERAYAYKRNAELISFSKKINK